MAVRLSALSTCRALLLKTIYFHLLLISVRGWVNPMAYSGRKDWVHLKKMHSPNRVSKSRPSGLWHSALIITLPRAPQYNSVMGLKSKPYSVQTKVKKYKKCKPGEVNVLWPQYVLSELQLTENQTSEVRKKLVTSSGELWETGRVAIVGHTKSSRH
jgi:hypothetical protein